MHRLVIVDDDEWIREGMRLNVAWERGHIQVVGTASDGKEGWELVQRAKPDILLSDIRMPFLDGLQLAELVRSHELDTKVVFLTGYDDFAYAKQALQLQAADYILKYEDNDKVLQAVVNAGQNLDEERRRLEQERKSRALMVNQFYSDLLAGVGSEVTIERDAKLLGLPFQEASFAVAVLCAKGGERFQKMNKPEDPELLLFSIRNLCSELLESHPMHGMRVQVIQYNGRINLLLQLASAGEETQRQTVGEAVQAVVDALWRYLKLTVSVGIGSFGAGHKSIPASYEEALIAAQLQDILPEQSVVFHDQVKYSHSSHQTMLKRITDYIGAHYDDEKLNLTKVAETVHMTPSYVSTLFKKYTDIGFSDYVIRVRMDKAAELLAHTDLKAYEVAERVGYPNTQYFSVLFKKHSGCTPMEYRQRRR